MADLTELKGLKDEYLSLQKKQAGLESSLESLKSQREALVNECVVLGVRPQDLQLKINEAKVSYDEAIASIKAKLYKQPSVIEKKPWSAPTLTVSNCPPATQPDLGDIFEESAI